MKIVRVGVCTLIMAAVLAVPASAFAGVALKLDPKRPTVSDSTITVSFVVKKQLPKHRRYTSVISIVPTGRGVCPLLASGRGHVGRPVKGKTVRLTFSSYDDPLNPGAKWCAGTAEITVSSLGKTDTGTLLGHQDFTLRR